MESPTRDRVRPERPNLSTCRIGLIPVGFGDLLHPDSVHPRRKTRHADKENPVSGRRTPQTLAPDVLRWARRRAGLAPERLAAKMKVKLERLHDWEDSGRISLAQADRMARCTRTPLGYLFLKSASATQWPRSSWYPLGK